MKIAVGSDHAGYRMKEKVKEILKVRGIEIIDFGTNSEESVDYPDFGLMVARAVAEGKVDYGITVCWTGNGMNMTANKVKGIRAGMGLNPDMAYLTRSHNNANILTLASKYIPENQLEEIIKNFLETPFEGGRHERRVAKIKQAESQ
ncbi:MAG: ribose 5-phosphate isomerase B [Candidatus Zixiibacteriota bacterium]